MLKEWLLINQLCEDGDSVIHHSSTFNRTTLRYEQNHVATQYLFMLRLRQSLCWCLILYNAAVAQVNHIRNFLVVNRNSTHITFSWEIVDGYYTSSDIRSFRLYYQGRFSRSTSFVPITYSSTTQSGGNFQYTTPLDAFGHNNYGEYTMWIRLYRDNSQIPRYTYSERKYVNIGKLKTL